MYGLLLRVSRESVELSSLAAAPFKDAVFTNFTNARLFIKLFFHIPVLAICNECVFWRDICDA